MCRASAEGGRRCAGGSSRTRAHGAIRQRVSRARRAVAEATAAGDTAAVTSANARLTEATEALTAHNTAHRSEQESRMDSHQPTPEQPTDNTAGQLRDVTDDPFAATLRHRVQEARRAVDNAIAADDHDAFTSAKARLDKAAQDFDDHKARIDEYDDAAGSTADQAGDVTGEDAHPRQHIGGTITGVAVGGNHTGHISASITDPDPAGGPHVIVGGDHTGTTHVTIRGRDGAVTHHEDGDATGAKAAPSTPNTPPVAKTPKPKAKQSATRRQPRKGSGTRRRRSESDVVVHPRSTTPPPAPQPDAHQSEQDEFRALWQSFKAPEARAAKASTPDTPPPAPENHQAPRREPHSDTSSPQKHEQTTSDQPRVTDYTAPDGTRFTNYAAPGATVGAQIGVMHGPTTFTSGSDFDPFRGPASNTTTSDPRPEREHAAGDSRTTASGTDYVEQQIGIQYGPTFHGKSSQ
ncbi:hypothetical protein VSH64_36985 [Amycolatopsis rhabdoformis]|uniref:DUF4226 domain-containing protein n=1 Tax=Amycolatopsis rhabdoformis TaxID=1448059 RepID=A0ABZ1I3N7_9PSEU|nr:hypothetical protein [Amycolatopsis rhabdoformis]WSE28391.1 hypothetical protein VSH64_36985 [Amycolatopsis rhabdoformis]